MPNSPWLPIASRRISTTFLWAGGHCLHQPLPTSPTSSSPRSAHCSHLGSLLSLKHPALLSATGPLHIPFPCLKCTSLTPVHSHPSHSKRPKSSVSRQTSFPQRCLPGTSLVVQGIRICLPRQGTRVRSLVWKDSTCCEATKHTRHNY